MSGRMHKKGLPQSKESSCIVVTICVFDLRGAYLVSGKPGRADKSVFIYYFSLDVVVNYIVNSWF